MLYKVTAEDARALLGGLGYSSRVDLIGDGSE
jgi:hypothetical protein